MYMSNTLSRALAFNTHLSARQVEYTVCSMVEGQLAIEHINVADYLNVTEKRLIQIKKHTDRGSQLLASRIKDETEKAARILAC